MLAARGAAVVVVDIDGGLASEVASRLAGRAFALDVGDEEATSRVIDAVYEEYARVDVLVTSAGILQVPGRARDLALSDWNRVMDIDLRGTWLSASLFGERMRRAASGSIVTVASVTGMRSVPLHAYAPAKAAVIAMTADLAAEWGRFGVRVNAVSPGYTATPAITSAIERGERDPSVLENEAAMGRMVRPDEVARAVCFLASDEASAITGVNLPVDGGWLVAPSWHTYGGVPSGD
jgi:NAD(P)-dependent dehydrogenase (short-subunit alcohol dehydrogenase family)